jgi:hypothetical protein
VEASLLAIAVCQAYPFRLALRYRGQARSHSDLCDAKDYRQTTNLVGAGLPAMRPDQALETQRSAIFNDWLHPPPSALYNVT